MILGNDTLILLPGTFVSRYVTAWAGVIIQEQPTEYDRVRMSSDNIAVAERRTEHNVRSLIGIRVRRPRSDIIRLP